MQNSSCGHQGFFFTHDSSVFDQVLSQNSTRYISNLIPMSDIMDGNLYESNDDLKISNNMFIQSNTDKKPIFKKSHYDI